MMLCSRIKVAVTVWLRFGRSGFDCEQQCLLRFIQLLLQGGACFDLQPVPIRCLTFNQQLQLFLGWFFEKLPTKKNSVCPCSPLDMDNISFVVEHSFLRAVQLQLVSCLHLQDNMKQERICLIRYHPLNTATTNRT